MELVKPGPKTTEFWVTLVTVLAGLALTMGWLKPEMAQEAAEWADLVSQVTGALLAALATAGYAISRGMAKE